MKRAVRALIFVVAAGVLSGCAPLIHVENTTGVGVRAVVTQGSSRGRIANVLRLPPNGSDSVLAVEGIYTVVSSTDEAWGAYIKGVRDELEGRLKDSRTISPDAVRLVTTSLGNLIQEFERLQLARQGVKGVCRGTIGNSEDDVRVLIVLGPSGTILPECGSSAKKTAPAK